MTRDQPPTRTEILRAAALVLEKHGTEAVDYALCRAYDLKAQGDRDGEATWCRIMYAVEELGRVERRPDERQH